MRENRWVKRYRPVKQEAHAFFKRHLAQMEGLCVQSQGLPAGCEEQITARGWRQELLDQFWMLHIVEDQEPVAMAGEPAVNSSDDLLLVLFLPFREVE